MADNFDMKQFLMENKLGAYSKLKTEGEAAYEYEKGKEAGEQEEKEKTKESLDDEDDIEAGGIENDIEQDLMYTEDPILYLKSIIDFCTKKIGEIEQSGSEDSEMQEAKKEEIKEALSPEMFERMDALTSHTAQIAMIKAAEIMMNELTEEGFEVLDIREYFTQLIANDI